MAKTSDDIKSYLQPTIILVEPQMGENIGASARAMWNFGLDRLRIVRPRDGWPNQKAVVMALSLIHISEPTRRVETRMPSSA